MLAHIICTLTSTDLSFVFLHSSDSSSFSLNSAAPALVRSHGGRNNGYIEKIGDNHYDDAVNIVNAAVGIHFSPLHFKSHLSAHASVAAGEIEAETDYPMPPLSSLAMHSFASASSVSHSSAHGSGHVGSIEQDPSTAFYQRALDVEKNIVDCPPIPEASIFLIRASMEPRPNPEALFKCALYVWTHVVRGLGCTCLANTNACETNLRLTKALLEKASGLGSENATFHLGLFYGFALKDQISAAELFLKVNPNSIALVNFFAGIVHIDRAKSVQGQSWIFEMEQALLFFQRGSDMGVTHCKMELSKLYLNGIGVQQNKDQALALETEAANQGDARVRRVK